MVHVVKQSSPRVRDSLVWKEINVHGAWRKGGWTSINREREQGVGMYKSLVKKVLVFDGF